MRRYTLGLVSAFALSLALGAPAYAEPALARYDIHPQNLRAALNQFSKTCRCQIFYRSDILDGLASRRVSGNLTQAEALAALMAGTNLQYRKTSTGVWLIEQRPAASPPPAPAPPPAPMVTPMPEVLVLGIREAIVQSLDAKRRSDFVSESVRSEDVGKMPDRNLAEALQRVPGIAIDRDGGEGRYVTIRGFGPSLNTVLINGRRVATSEQTRAFAFDTISSALVGRIDVFKTQSANIEEGGVGGTVDIRTLHPLDRPGLHASATIEGSREQNSGKTSPQGSFLVSDSFLDDRLGVLLSGSYQKRQNRTYQAGAAAENGGLRTQNVFTIDGYVNGFGTNYWNYGNFGVAKAMNLQELDRNVYDETRTRKGFTADVQYKLSDDMEFNVDYLYSKFDVVGNETQVGNWFWNLMPPPGQASWILSNLYPNGSDSLASWQALTNYIAATSQTAVDANGVVTKATAWPGDVGPAYNGLLKHRPTVTQMVGINYTWRVSDKLQMTVDGAYSTADLNNPGLDQRRSLETLLPGTSTYINDGDVPYVVNSSSGVSDISNFNTMTFGRAWNSGSVIKGVNKEASVNFDYAPSDTLKFKFGALYEKGSKSSTDWMTPMWVQMMYKNASKPLTAAQLQSLVYGVLKSDPADFGMPAGADTNALLINYPATDAFVLNPANLNTTFLTKSQAEIDAFKAYAAAHGGSPFAAEPTGTGYVVSEAVKSLYADMTKDFQIFGKDAVLTGGLRYTMTKTQSAGYSQLYSAITLTAPLIAGMPPVVTGVPITGQGPSGLSYVTAGHSYNNLLPDVNLKINATDDLVIRFAASKSLTRPELSYLAPITLGVGFGLNGGTITRNNPDLRPMVSTNLDAAAEWYYGAGNAVTLDLFWKKLDGFITQAVTQTGYTIPGLNNTAVYNGQTYNVNSGNFAITSYANAQAAQVWGATIGWTHTFDFGLGFQTNYTLTGTNRKFDADTYDSTKVTLPGLSKNFNAVAFYEHGPISARVAYNWRSQFLSNPAFPAGQYGSAFEPEFTKPYSQIDARFGYNLNKHVQAYVEGVNLGNSKVTNIGRYSNLFINNQNYGSRITVGVNMKY